VQPAICRKRRPNIRWKPRASQTAWDSRYRKGRRRAATRIGGSPGWRAAQTYRMASAYRRVPARTRPCVRYPQGSINRKMRKASTRLLTVEPQAFRMRRTRTAQFVGRVDDHKMSIRRVRNIDFPFGAGRCCPSLTTALVFSFR
jgi:hypothetical protein